MQAMFLWKSMTIKLSQKHKEQNVVYNTVNEE